MKNNKVISHG